jgi:very-short-patch-repair endonuclease
MPHGRLPYKTSLKEFARQLRKNMTDAERTLWQKIRRKQIEGYQFYRQKAIGHFIVDFYCPAAKLVIEVDGGQHYSEEGIRKDRARNGYLEGLGLTVLRFSDRDVFKNMTGVLDGIHAYLKNPPIPPLERGAKPLPPSHIGDKGISRVRPLDGKNAVNSKSL